MPAEISQQHKGEAFRALHVGSPFVIPNPWDAGTAKVFAALGFEALATTSAGFAFTLGRQDGDVTLDEVVEHTRALAAATSLPISVDLENGYGPDPADAARAVSRAAEAGAVGGSIEDYDPAGGIYELEHAIERVAAAVEASGDLDFPFTLTARAAGTGAPRLGNRTSEADEGSTVMRGERSASGAESSGRSWCRSDERPPARARTKPWPCETRRVSHPTTSRR